MRNLWLHPFLRFQPPRPVVRRRQRQRSERKTLRVTTRLSSIWPPRGFLRTLPMLPPPIDFSGSLHRCSRRSAKIGLSYATSTRGSRQRKKPRRATCRPPRRLMVTECRVLPPPGEVGRRRAQDFPVVLRPPMSLLAFRPHGHRVERRHVVHQRCQPTTPAMRPYETLQPWLQPSRRDARSESQSYRLIPLLVQELDHHRASRCRQYRPILELERLQAQLPACRHHRCPWIRELPVLSQRYRHAYQHPWFRPILAAARVPPRRLWWHRQSLLILVSHSNAVLAWRSLLALDQPLQGREATWMHDLRADEHPRCSPTPATTASVPHV
jgi:hypothetical protein